MGIFSNLLGKNKQTPAAQANALFLEMLKRGKSAEQCKCIDYLYAPDEEAKKGCLAGGKKKKKKKGGCMSKNAAWDMDDYIAYVQQKVDALCLKQKAIDKIGLDESEISEIPPVAISSFVYNTDHDDEGIIKVKTADSNIEGLKISVTNKFEVTWIFFSATQIYTYTYRFDTISDDVLERTRDFFYTDITSIRTEHQIVEHIYEKKEGCGCLKKKAERYVHANQHWDRLWITVPNDSYSFWVRTNDTIEQSIMATKAMIREKKNG